MMWPFHSTSDSHGLPDFVCDLIQRANQRRSNAIKVVGGGSQTQQGYGGTGVRGFRGFRGHFIDRDNFLRTFARFVVYQISNRLHDHILSSFQKNINEI